MKGRVEKEIEDMIRGPFCLDTDGHLVNEVIQEEPMEVQEDEEEESIMTAQANDEILGQVIVAIKEGKTGEGDVKWYVERCEIDEDGVLVTKDRDQRRGEKRIVIPEVYRKKVFDQFHRSRYGGGHMNIDKTMAKASKYWWKGMRKDMAIWHKECWECQLRAPKRYKVTLVMTKLNRPFERVGIDICGPLHMTSRGNLHYMLAID